MLTYWPSQLYCSPPQPLDKTARHSRPAALLLCVWPLEILLVLVRSSAVWSTHASFSFRAMARRRKPWVAPR